RDFKDINIERIITTPISITNLENILTNKDACLNCGKLLTENFRFCPHCGAEV
ncbi:MAG: zinc ribbon domain-containing protein, partial [Syntrophomonadaceae bacterium]|nr:zinc ribbon domain-containing protein [Syntrophomonadaceae bacterium]